MTVARPSVPRRSLARFAWLSIVAALLTISLKGGAYALTGSVGLLSDALESVVNLVAAVVALIALTVAHQGPDEEHAYGHEKAEYFSSGIEGGLILLAAASIAYVSVGRLLHPAPPQSVALGLVISTFASLINLGAAWRLRHAARQYRSITLEADARHLLTDVWTSAGVIVGVAGVALTGWLWLDAVIALAVAISSGRGCNWCGAPRSACWTPPSPPPSGRRSGRSSRATRASSRWSSTRYGRGNRGRAASWRSMCWCRVAGRSGAAMRCWSAWSATCAPPSAR